MSYVINRESYDLSKFELRYRNIWSQSSKEVFEQYKKEIDAANPYSFYRLYTNQFKRLANITSLKFQHVPGRGASTAQLVIECPVISLSSGKEESSTKWRVELTYKYTDFWVDQSLDFNSPLARFFGLTGSSLKVSGERRKVVPMTFIVSDYTVKELLE
jgi:type IV secretory pathway component VirB8